jgi:SAM-dependent methyltransferase
MHENFNMESLWEAAGSDDTDWNARYRARDTPWDHGKAHPELVHWLSEHRFSGEVLVPGCGRGYDVCAIAKTGTRVLGVDIANEAIYSAQRRDKNAHFQVADILTPPPEWAARFSGAFEHTCYCAISPSRRRDYAQSLATVIQPGGIFLACFYMNPDAEKGPPFPTCREELDQFFHPYFRLHHEWVPSHTYPGREGRELFRQYVR